MTYQNCAPSDQLQPEVAAVKIIRHVPYHVLGLWCGIYLAWRYKANYGWKYENDPPPIQR